jgi:hypothetical protein
VHRPVYEFVSEIDQIESETRRLWALKGKLEAESAVLDTYIEVARKHAVLNEALAIPGNGQLKQLPYTPAFSMQRTR